MSEELGGAAAESPSFCLLADRPHFVPTLARWFWREWAPVYEDLDIHSEQEVIDDMVARCLNRDRIPLTLVAFVHKDGVDVPCATVSLDTEDLRSHKHLSPWLVCVYTEEHYRGRGLVGELLKRVLAKAREVGLSQVWLWTKDLTVPLYEKYGWVKKEGLVYQGYPISIMQVQLHSASSSAQ